MVARGAGIEWGKVQGRILIPEHIRAAAQAAGQEAYAEAEQLDFAGDTVVWLPEAAWHRECEALFPGDAVRELGFELSTSRLFRVYSTHGTDAHVDGDGAVFVLALANDGLKFRQGRQTHMTVAGEWYIFDDCRVHTVDASRRSTSYVFLHHALKAAG